MSLFGSIIGVASKIATTAYSIIKIALPILKALRPSITEIDKAFTEIESKIVEGGTVADDYLDRNIDAIRSLEDVCGIGSTMFAQLAEVCSMLDRFSQEETPDTITDEEAVALAEKLWEVRKLIAAWSEDSEAVVKALTAAE